MNQLPLLAIRPQPAQPAPAIPSKTIRAYVKEKMCDFPRRQREREKARKAYRQEQDSKPARKTNQEERAFMKTIPITYRAVFEQPLGPLNPMGAKLPGPQPVEIFRKGEHWYARELSTPRRNVFERLGKFNSADSARAEVSQAFEHLRVPWQTWGEPPNPSTVVKDFRPAARVLLPDEFCDLGDGKAGWYTAEDRTHIIHAPTIPPGAKIPPAACGAKVDTKHFISTRANVEPSCKACAEVWKEHYSK